MSYYNKYGYNIYMMMESEMQLKREEVNDAQE